MWLRSSLTSRRLPACQATCLGKSIFLDDVDTDPASAPTSITDGEFGGSPATRNHDGVVNLGPGFVAPGVAGRGSAYVADASLTRPALKIRNRVYVTRLGGVV